MRRTALVLLLALALSAGCRSNPGRSRVLVLGLDGADPKVIDLLMSEGKLPHFAKLRQEGAYAPLESMKPLLSPVVWTTIATGKTPDRHGIGHFTAVNPRTGEQLPVTSRMRKVRAIWNIASDAGREVAVVGWWATWPAETVKGSVVSDHLCYHFLFDEGLRPAAGPALGTTYPPELEKELAPMVRRPTGITPADAAPFVDVPAAEFDRPFRFEDDLGHFRWALATAQTYSDVGLKLWKERRPDLAMIYIEGLDSTSHLFGHLFRESGLAGELAEQQRRYGRAVEEMYRYADRIVGEMMEAMDARTTLVVLSDHGFHLGVLQDDPSRTRDMRRVSEQFHDPRGILYLYGAGVKPRTRPNAPSVLDVTPTLLALLGLPAAGDMPGRILEEALAAPSTAPRVATYEREGGTAPAEEAGDPQADDEMMEKLRSLGYLGAVSPTGDRNLAAVLFQEGKYAEAAEAYRALIARDPNDGSLRASLAGVLGAMGRYDEALAEANKAIDLQPLNPEAYHNRAVLYERKGDVASAIAEYRTALRYSPQYQPAREALRRLRAPEAPEGKTSGPEKRALALAEQASQAARRGDYKGAMRLLDEAQGLAPRYALLYQYRSNVAYLMGDRAGAESALKKGLEIEPDNALFRENLKRLQRAPAPPP